MSWAAMSTKHAVVTSRGGGRDVIITPCDNKTMTIQMGPESVVVDSRDIVEAIIAMSKESGWHLGYLRDEL